MKPFRLFPGIVFVLLGTNVCIVGATVYLANSDRSFAVVPDYYQKALAWNQTLAQQQRNAALGWSATVSVGAESTLGRTVSVRLLDRAGMPVERANVELIAFHDARAADQYGATLSEAAPGVYETAMPIERAGSWEFRIRVQHGTDVFTAEAQREVGLGT